MKLDLYEKIICEYEDLRKKYGVNQMKTIVNQLTIKFGDEQINYSTIYSLVNYEYRKEAKGWQNQTDKYELCAYNLLRQVVNEFCESKELAKKWLKDPSLCDDGKLANEIMIMNAHDIMDGIAFEMEVRTLLDQRRISYMSEDELRSRSYDVTPDFRLNIPLIVIQTHRKHDDNIPEKVDGEKERLVVTWIECKALFASLECHCEYYENQFYSYINRFGNGLILYKFGFVENFPVKYTRNFDHQSRDASTRNRIDDLRNFYWK
ncbi:hypothetical protein BLOT_006617 [Blomia tropicalis]|nr:hypothetical protein BLOT_006617 [Blomia tropicalis]